MSEYSDLTAMQQAMIRTTATGRAAHSDTDGIVDSDAHFVIDPITRKIIKNCQKTTLVRGDHNSERLTFECPRYIEGHDMLNCNKISINYSKTYVLYEVDDLCEGDENTVVFTWLIKESVTHNVGVVNFSILFQCIQDSGEITYQFGTDINTDLKVIDTINSGSEIAQENIDILKQMQGDIDNKVSSVNGSTPDESGNVEVEIPEGFSGSWDDLTDKPFYETKAVIPETTFTGEIAAVVNPIPFIRLVEGEEYIVTRNGVEYICTAEQIVTSTMRVGIGLGDAYRIHYYNREQDNPVPFAIEYDPKLDGSYTVYHAGDTDTTTIKVTVSDGSGVIIPLPEKYIPEDYINQLIEAKLSDQIHFKLYTEADFQAAHPGITPDEPPSYETAKYGEKSLKYCCMYNNDELLYSCHLGGLVASDSPYGYIIGIGDNFEKYKDMALLTKAYVEADYWAYNSTDGENYLDATHCMVCDGINFNCANDDRIDLYFTYNKGCERCIITLYKQSGTDLEEVW